MWLLRLPPQEGVVEIPMIIVIAVLVLGVAVGPLLAMRNPAEPTSAPRGRPGQQVGQGAGRQRNTTESPTPRHTKDQP
jgi:hypothetical protein